MRSYSACFGILFTTVSTEGNKLANMKLHRWRPTQGQIYAIEGWDQVVLVLARNAKFYLVHGSHNLMTWVQVHGWNKKVFSFFNNTLKHKNSF